MTSDSIIRKVRAALLVGLLVYFSLSLYAGLVKDEKAGGFGKQSQGSGNDPGIRVLLSSRGTRSNIGPQAASTRWHDDKVDVTILQPVMVVAPDDADNPERRLALKPGTKLTVVVNAGDGLILSSRGWGNDGQQIVWNVSRIRVVPMETFPAVNADDNPLPKRDPTHFEANDRDAVFMLGDRRYRGSAEIIWHSPKDLAVVNCLPLEAYIEGVVAVEMSPSFPLEALKAQAILSRSFAYARRLPNLSASKQSIYEVIDGIDDQDYRGTGNGSRVVQQAVIDTQGIVTYTDRAQGGNPFTPLFCASSGGFTADARSVLIDARDANGRSLPRETMSPRQDDYCQKGAEGLGYLSTHWTTQAILEPKVIRETINRYLKQKNDPRQIGYIQEIKVLRREARSNRVLSLAIHHTLPSSPFEMSCHEFRMAMGPSVIRSTLWNKESPKRIDSVDGKPKNYLIQMCGYGHGVGMSQISAWEMARQGFSARAIIEYFYFQGLELRKVW